ncbi:hypothetical protein UF75_2444 [Desulfosporosinus sp. I2]|nr:hypothetical protein UF75_2444 [Desulfosporosinus sp. I2]
MVLQLIVNPAVNLPVLIDQAILLGEIVVIFVRGNLIGIVVGFPVNFDRYF